MHPTLQMAKKCSNDTFYDTILRARFGHAVFQNVHVGVGQAHGTKSLDPFGLKGHPLHTLTVWLKKPLAGLKFRSDLDPVAWPPYRHQASGGGHPVWLEQESI